MKHLARIAAVAAGLAACGDDAPSFVDAGARDAATGDAATPDDGATPDGGAVPDGGTVPDGAVLGDGSVAIDGGPVTIDAAPQSGWHGPQLIEMMPEGASAPVVGMDGAGRAIAAWRAGTQDPENENVSTGQIVASRFDPATGWGTPVALSATAAEFGAEHVDLAMNAGGDAFAAWYEYGASNETHLLVRRFRPGTGWDPVTTLIDGPGVANAWMPHIAIADDGTAMVLYSVRVGLDDHLYTRRYTPAVGWGTPVLVHAPAGDALGFDLALDGGGGAFAVWTVRAGGGTLWGARYRAGEWTPPARLDQAAVDAGFVDADDAHLAVDIAGHAAVIWKTFDGEDQMVWGTSATPTGTWQTAMRLDAPGVYALSPDIAGDGSGRVIAVWHGWADGEAPSIRARRFTPAGGWGPLEAAETTPDTSVFPRVAMSPAGTATVVWQERSTVARTWANRLVAGAGWGTAVAIDTTQTGASGVDVAVAAGGADDAVAVWPFNPNPVDNHPTPYDLWANVFR